MAESIVLASLQDIWNAYNIRGFMILSLFIQFLLASTARLRKKSTSRFTVFVIWSAYFTADWAATFTFGLISNAQRIGPISPPEVDKKLQAFWAAFLLIHLGGPDTITAFSLEDNALWMRHLVGLVAQLFTFFYIFIKTLPGNNLVIPTILIAVAGTIKYGERTRALYLASMENLKQSTGKVLVTDLDDLNWASSSRKSKEANYFFQIFKGLVVDIMPNHAERSQSREFFLKKGAKEVFDKSWCENLGAFSLLSHHIRQCQGMDSKPMKYACMISGICTFKMKGEVSWNPLDDDTQNFIFDELKERASVAFDDEENVKEIYEARGRWILTKLGINDELIRYVTKFDYDRSLLTWHIATEICHNVDSAVEVGHRKQRKLAVILSDYMNYLLIKKPEMMSAVAGIAHIRYRDTCAEIQHFCRVFTAGTVYEFCTRILNEDTNIEPASVYKDKGTSVLSDVQSGQSTEAEG